MVLSHFPWCSDCEEDIDTFEKAESNFFKENPDKKTKIRFIMIEGEKQTELVK